MDLKSNPFYILDVSADANRRDVIEAAEEKGFFFDAETCAEAQNTLINANKRLMAELGWFVDLEDTELASIKAAIGASQEISTEGLQSLSRLTALVHNLEILNEEDPYLLGYTISEINETFRSLDPDELLESINSHREKAGFALCSNQEIVHGINERRTEIKQIIADKLNVLSDGDYTELARILGEQMVENNNVDNAVISDVIDSYEVRIQTVLEGYTERIESLIADYRNNLSEVSVLKLQRLISIVKEWDKLAQPLQLKSQASGMPHRISEDIGNQMRDLAVDLHNDEGKSEEALLITDAMRDVFAELVNLNDKFSEDTNILKNLISGQKYAEEINSDMDSLESAGKLLQDRPLESNVNGYIALVKKLNNKLQTLDLPDDVQEAIRTNLGFMVLGTAVDLHNNAHETVHALHITECVAQEFKDLPEVSQRANENVQSLQTMVDQAAKSFSSNTTHDAARWIVRFIPLLILIAIFAFGGACDSGTHSSHPSNSQTTNNSTPAVSTEKQELSDQMDELGAEIDALEEELTTLNSNIESYQAQLDSLASDMDYYEEQYNATGSDEYYNAFYDAQDEYNSIVEKHNDALNQYNTKYASYEEKLDTYNELVEKYNNM